MIKLLFAYQANSWQVGAESCWASPVSQPSQYYEARLFVLNLINTKENPSIVNIAIKHHLIKELIKMQFSVHFQLRLSSFAFKHC